MAWLILLFVGSGCSALIYEIVWFQLLELVIGASAVSMAVLLATFMGGMCLGSLYAPRISHNHHPLRIYALLEIGIAISGMLLLYASPFAGGLTFRALICGLCLMPPTFLMGATLPVIARWIETTPQGSHYLACSTPATSPVQCSVHYLRASICFDSTTWRLQRTSQSLST